MTDQRFVKTDIQNLIRDNDTSAVLNTDSATLFSYKKERERLLKIDSVFYEVENLKKDIIELKELMAQLIADKYKESYLGNNNG